MYTYRCYNIIDIYGYWYIFDEENRNISIKFGAKCYSTDKDAERAIDEYLNVPETVPYTNDISLNVKSTTLHNLKVKHSYFKQGYIYVLRNKYNNSNYASRRGTVYELNSPDILIFRDEEVAYKTKIARTNGRIYKIAKVWYSNGYLGK